MRKMRSAAGALLAASFVAGVLVAGLLAPAPAAAQADPLPDGIGIFADTGAMVNSIAAEPFTVIDVYLLATRLTVPLSGWECSIVAPANAQTLSFTPAQPSAILLKNESALMCGTGVILPAADIVHLLTFQIMMTDGEPGHFFLAGHPVDSGGYHLPTYVSDPVEVLLALHPYPRLQGQPVFLVNESAQPVTSATWGGLKALFGR